jgi:GNAT superfamily N-acetyltransferase
MAAARPLRTWRGTPGDFAAVTYPLRIAQAADIPALAALIPTSVRALQAAHYSPAQMDAALGTIFAVDRQLIDDGTYFVVEDGKTIAGCGGWSRRRSLFGGDAARAAGDSDALDPARDPARIRAFFVHPDWARRGIGRQIMHACEAAIGKARFRSVELVATLAGEPLYAAFAYTAVERYSLPLAGGLLLPVVRMVKELRAP